MKTQHTPGPWEAEKPGVYQHNGICVAQRHAQAGPEWPANARLIAAAPDLLTALEDLLAYADDYSDFMTERSGLGAAGLGKGADSVSVAGVARAAIEKATK